MAWEVLIHPEAVAERATLPPRERAAIDHSIDKLSEIGPRLGFPHSSAVLQSDNLRELRPRAGRSPWRAFYRQMGNAYVVAAIGPEAQNNPRGFRKAVMAAEARLETLTG